MGYLGDLETTISAVWRIRCLRAWWLIERNRADFHWGSGARAAVDPASASLSMRLRVEPLNRRGLRLHFSASRQPHCEASNQQEAACATWAQFQEIRVRATPQPPPPRRPRPQAQPAPRDLLPRQAANALTGRSRSAAQAPYARDQGGTELWNRCSSHVPGEPVGKEGTQADYHPSRAAPAAQRPGKTSRLPRFDGAVPTLSPRQPRGSANPCNTSAGQAGR